MFVKCCISVLPSIMFIQKLLICYPVVFMFIEKLSSVFIVLVCYYVVFCSFLSTVLFFGLPLG